MVRLFLALLLGCSLLIGSSPEYQSAKRKFALIENDKAAPGSTVFISTGELNAWARAEAPREIPAGVREPELSLGYGAVTGSALVDFLKLREKKGVRTSWLLSRLLEGEQPVAVTARIQSGAGSATVDVERVDISGVSVSGAALDFLIENFLLPYFPTAKIGQPFELGHRIERLNIRPSGLGVVIAR